VLFYLIFQGKNWKEFHTAYLVLVGAVFFPAEILYLEGLMHCIIIISFDFLKVDVTHFGVIFNCVSIY
jgi:hypothetical protein